MADEQARSGDDAPHPVSDEFDAEHNPAEKVSPGTTADAPATDPDLISTEPGGGPGVDTDQVRAEREDDPGR